MAFFKYRFQRAGLRCVFAAGLVIFGAIGMGAGPAAAAQPLALEETWSDPAWMSAARGLHDGEALRVVEIDVEKLGLQNATLQRFRVFTPDARVVVHGASGVLELPAPDNVYLRGRLDGRPSSSVLLTIRASGELRGIVVEDGQYWVVGEAVAAKGGSQYTEVRAVSLAALAGGRAGFMCEVDSGKLTVGDSEAFDILELGSTLGRDSKRSVSHTARIGVETDYEYYSKFGNTADATDYAADLIAYTSSIYENELETSMMISYMSLWTTTADPWAEASPGCGLYEYGRYWNDNNVAVTRTTALFLSGKSQNSGIAWVGVLCNGQFTVNLTNAGCPGLTPSIDNYGGAYAYVGGVDGNFDINNPSVLWDIVATSHELGHNFNSPHTHCYEGLGGNASAIDECYNGQCGNAGCFCGTTSLPCATPGAGCGTIMSYCHLRSPYMSNLTLTLGRGHPYGVAPERVPDRMAAHVASRASSYPGCLDAVIPDLIFEDDFESNSFEYWSDTVPGTP